MSPFPSEQAASDALIVDQQLCFALYSTTLAMTRVYQPLLQPFGLTYPQYLVLLVLWEHGDQAVSQIGARLSLDSGTLTPLLKRLEAAGYVRRRRDSADERRVTVSLTERGVSFRAQAVSVFETVACATACELDELTDLVARLHGLRASLNAYDGSPAR